MVDTPPTFHHAARRSRPDRRAILRALAAWCLPAVIVAVFLWQGLGGPSRDFRVPVAFSGDALFYLAQSKATIDHGWWWWNPSIGVPFGYPALVFAQNNNVDQGIIWLVSRFTSQVGPVVTVGWVLMSVLGALAANWGLRRAGVSAIGSAAAGVLFAVAPFALSRSVIHFALVTYLVPFAATGALLLASAPAHRRWRLPGGATIVTGCVLLGFNHIYYAFFGAALMSAATLIGFGRTRSVRVLKAGAVCVGAVVLATALNLLPNVLAWRAHGEAQGVHHIVPEAEIYGLKLRHLVSPVEAHWFPPFRAWISREDAARFPLENENARSRLGVVTSIGFIGLLIVMVFPVGRPAAQAGGDTAVDTVGAAAKLTLAALLLGMIGAFGSLFSLLVSSEIRGYNRVTPFIAFFALAALGWWIDRMTMDRRRARVGLWLVLLLIGLADHSPAFRNLTRDAEKTEHAYHDLQQFVSALETALPPGSAVFQLPIRPYPADAGIGRMDVYDHFGPYLVSQTLRWSYPALAGEQYAWERTLLQLPVADLPRALAQQGFRAVLVNRSGYADGGAAIERVLRDASGDRPALAERGHLVAIDLRDLATSAAAQEARR